MELASCLVSGNFLTNTCRRQATVTSSAPVLVSIMSAPLFSSRPHPCSHIHHFCTRSHHVRTPVLIASAPLFLRPSRLQPYSHVHHARLGTRQRLQECAPYSGNRDRMPFLAANTLSHKCLSTVLQKVLEASEGSRECGRHGVQVAVGTNRWQGELCGSFYSGTWPILGRSCQKPHWLAVQ